MGTIILPLLVFLHLSAHIVIISVVEIAEVEAEVEADETVHHLLVTQMLNHLLVTQMLNHLLVTQMLNHLLILIVEVEEIVEAETDEIVVDKILINI